MHVTIDQTSSSTVPSPPRLTSAAKRYKIVPVWTAPHCKEGLPVASRVEGLC